MSVYKSMSDYELSSVIKNGHDALDVITIDEKVDSFTSWCYRVQVEHPFEGDYLVLNKESGTSRFCDCPTCQDFGDSRNELFAIYKALKWIRKNCKTFAVTIFTVSEDADFRDYFDIDPSVIACPFLRDITSEIQRIMESISVKFVHTTCEELAWKLGLGEL